MRFLAVVLAVFCVAAAGCRSSQAAVASSARTVVATGSPLAPANSRLDAEAAMPSGFPSDFPIYPHARLTAAAAFTSTGQLAWGMEWQTVEGQALVQAFYTKQLNQADWTMTVTSTAYGEFAATFSRKSDSHVTGTLAANWDAPVTKILVSLVSTG